MTVVPGMDDVARAGPSSTPPPKEEELTIPRHGYAGTLRPPVGPEPDWIDRFMEQILQRDYDSAREVLRAAVAQGIGKSVAEQYGKVLEEFLQRRDEVDKPTEIACFGACALREMDNQTGRGLIVPGYINYADEFWRQRPVAYIQSPSSRKCVQVCSACLVPVGTLASQLVHLGLPVPEGAEDVQVVSDALPFVQCPGGCGQVFCGDACCKWARESSSHALLCRGRLSADAADALEALDQLSVETEQEHLLLLAHHVAVALLRRLAGDELPDVWHRYVKQFFSQPWETLADEDGTDGDTPSYRKDLLEKSAGLLWRIFVGQELATPFLEVETLSSMLGTYELVNMCISIPHPLNLQSDHIAELLQGPALAKLHALQKGVDDDSDDEDDEENAEVGAEICVKESPLEAGSDGHLKAALGHDVAQPDVEPTKEQEAAALEAVAAKSLFGSVVGTSLCEALSFMNHSCLPNARIDFATSATPNNASGPGLWVFAQARRPLIPGDEVQMCYVPSVVGRPVEIRQKRMKRFGFECRCRCCTTDLMLQEDDPYLGGFVRRAGE